MGQDDPPMDVRLQRSRSPSEVGLKSKRIRFDSPGATEAGGEVLLKTHESRLVEEPPSKPRPPKAQRDKEKPRNVSRRRASRNDELRARGAADVNEDIPKAPRLPKRQCALLLGFCGTSFNGMQMCV